MRKPAGAVAALLSLVALLAGCGGGVDKNAYVKAVSGVQAQTQTEAKTISDKMQKAKSQAEIADDLDELGTKIKAQSTALSKIEAPDDVKSEHADYAKAIADFGTTLGGLATKVRTATPDNVKDVLTDASQATSSFATKEQQIVQDINGKLQG